MLGIDFKGSTKIDPVIAHQSPVFKFDPYQYTLILNSV